MAQALEVTEKSVNGIEHSAPILKSINSDYVNYFIGVDATGSDDTEVSLRGRATKDTRIVDENYAGVLAVMNGATTTQVEKALSLTVKKSPGKADFESVPYLQAFTKLTVVEFYANPQDAADTIIVVARGKNDMERKNYIVDDTYADVKAMWLL